MALTPLMNRLNRVEYAIEAVENVHGGEDCPDGYCDRCLDKYIAVGDRIAELPRLIRVAMWVCAPRASWHTWQNLKEARALRKEWADEASQEADRVGTGGPDQG